MGDDDWPAKKRNRVPHLWGRVCLIQLVQCSAAVQPRSGCFFFYLVFILFKYVDSNQIIGFYVYIINKNNESIVFEFGVILL